MKTGDVPRMALDNLRRPTVDLSGVIQGQGALGKASQMPNLPMGLNDGAYEALGHVGTAIARAGSVVGAVQQEKQDAIDKIAGYETAQAWHAKQDEFAAWREGEGALRPETWVNKWDELTADFNPIPEHAQLSPRGRQMLELETGAIRNGYRTGLEKNSTKEIFHQAGQALQHQAGIAYEMGDAKTGDAFVKQGEGKYFPDWRAEELRRDGAEKVKQLETDKQVAEVKGEALASPRLWLERNQEAPADPVKYEAWRHGQSAARASVGAQTQAASDDIADAFASRDVGTLTDQDVEKLSGGRLSQASLESHKELLHKLQTANWKAENFSEDGVAKNYAALIEEADKFKGTRGDPKSDDAYSRLMTKIKTLLPEGLRGEVSEPINRKYTGVGAPQAPAPVKDLVNDTLQSWYKDQRFGVTKKMVPDPSGESVYSADKQAMVPKMKEVEDPKGRDSARVILGKAQIYMDKWLKATPDATPEAAKAEMLKASGAALLPRDVDALLRKPVSATAAPTIDWNAVKNRVAPPTSANETVGYPVVSSDAAPTEIRDYLNANPKVAGMAWGGGENGSGADEPRSVIVNESNQYMKDPVRRSGLIMIEAARHKMSEIGYSPTFEITQEQQKWRKELGGAYAKNDDAFRKTIVSRLIVGDDVPSATKTQKAEAEKIRKLLPRAPSKETVGSESEALRRGATQDLGSLAPGANPNNPLLPPVAIDYGPTDAPGMLKSGNVNLADRPQVKNADGSISTVRSMSFEEDGVEILVPTVSDDGKILSEREAVNLYHKTGKFLGKFKSAKAATAYAQKLHEEQAKFYGIPFRE